MIAGEVVDVLSDTRIRSCSGVKKASDGKVFSLTQHVQIRRCSPVLTQALASSDIKPIPVTREGSSGMYQITYPSLHPEPISKWPVGWFCQAVVSFFRQRGRTYDVQEVASSDPAFVSQSG